MARELPGFYFDPEKNRYFPIQHRAAGASQICKTKVASSSVQSKSEAQKRKQTNKLGAVELLYRRELAGRILPSGNISNVLFQRELMELQASLAKVWMYDNTSGKADGAVEQFLATKETLDGSKEANVLIVGGRNGSLGLYEVEGTREQLEYDRIICRRYPFVSTSLNQRNPSENQPSPIWTIQEPELSFESNITAIKRLGRRSDFINHEGLNERALFTTLGSGSVGGSLYSLNLNAAPQSRLSKCISTSCTIWTADSNFDGTRAIIGTNQGTALVDIEHRRLSWVCRSKSDVLSQQFDQSGNHIFCGFRNGAIVTVDIRSEESAQFASMHRHAVRHAAHSFSLNDGSSKSLSGKFRLKGNVNPSDAIYMPTAVCSLAALQSDDKYLLASSMNGTIKLWDRRLIERGSVQSYEGNVNSHTMIQIGVDPTESLLASGGEDGAIRLWNVKTGKLLHTEVGFSSPVTTICWPKYRKMRESSKEEKFYEDTSFEQKFCWGLWLGSFEGLLYMHGGG
ncbi:uncharacterized protein LOC131074707 isoform X1 [Cryptomeria japonica]|uniref:uncharacterized protein LOC131074707 isoform X1 n=2 Tax=Cryptomeria japonica TaxID=3369 RepID=UPI0025AC479E|nr:uncharacterized protein LOC131074707 isoform X1 [Cryptomeria japonica]XP_057867381.1 uncharacterized protein LOC131074707 isoform X1 [Cryptomeria japonica]